MRREKKFENVEQQEEMIIEQNQRITIIYEALNPSEEPFIDILWMKKAAKTSLESGTPYFNVIESKVTKRYVDQYQTELSVMEGIIEVVEDPLDADYDAYEIGELYLEL